MSRLLLPVALLWLLLPAVVVSSQVSDDDPSAEVPLLTEIFEGSGRMDGVTFAYPEGWFTLEGIPANRLVSFNVVSSVRLGLRSRIEPGEEALVIAFAGGRISRWPTIDPEATPEEILTAFFERLGDDSQFGRDDEAEAGEFEQVTETFTLSDTYDAVLVRFEEVVEDAATADANVEDGTDEAEFNGEFLAYSIRLDDNHFLVALVLTSELSYDDVQPTLDAMLDTLTYTPE